MVFYEFKLGGMIVARGKLSQEEMNALKASPYVSDVEENRIIYTNEFKFLFMQEYQNGKKPTQIFKEAGFDPKILGAKRIERAASRWKKSYETGGLGSYENGTFRRNKNEEIQNLQQNFQYEKYLEILEKQQKRIEFLERENEFLRGQLV